MNKFDERQKSFEKKFAKDQELQFKVSARSNKYLGEWASSKLGKKETEKEDRKDERTRIQASQQSELIDQRNTQKPPKNFESAGNDILGGGFGLNAFDPR